MIQIIISFTINFIVLVIALTIFRRIVLNNLKKQLREKNMLPEIGVRKIGGKYSTYFKYGCQAFVVFTTNESDNAESFKKLIEHFFTQYKNGIIDEI